MPLAERSLAPIDLLANPLFTVAWSGSPGSLSVSGLVAALLTGPEIDGLPALAAEQHGYVWRFLVRCAAKALHDIGLDVDAASRALDLAPRIAAALRAAAPDGAWDLYQHDPDRPGFLQAPAPGGVGPASGYVHNPPAMLTGALGAKNHERKSDAVQFATAEQVVYALVEYQSAAIYGGRGNYASQLTGSASGAGSGTSFMGARIGGSNVETFRHDVTVLLWSRERIRRDHGLEGPVWAVWAEPWDGVAQLPSRRLDPAFIPFARRVRLGPPGEDGTFRSVWFRPSEKARVEDLAGGGNLGDPFTPLVADPKDRTARKVRGTLGKGYDYAEVARLLFGEDAVPSPSVRALQDADDGERPDLAVLFEGVAYEQGKTGGFHRRLVPLPPGATGFFSRLDPVRATHGAMLDRVKKTQSALRGAARVYLSGEPRPRDGDAARAGIPAEALNAAVDAIYLEHLFRNASRDAAGDHDWTRAWGAELEGVARRCFAEALPSLPVPVARRFEREVSAWGNLDFKLAQVADPDAALRPRTTQAETEEITA